MNRNKIEVKNTPPPFFLDYGAKPAPASAPTSPRILPNPQQLFFKDQCFIFYYFWMKSIFFSNHIVFHIYFQKQKMHPVILHIQTSVGCNNRYGEWLSHYLGNDLTDGSHHFRVQIYWPINDHNLEVTADERTAAEIDVSVLYCLLFPPKEIMCFTSLCPTTFSVDYVQDVIFS